LTDPAPGPGIRVLMVLGCSDVTDTSLRALDLHRHLAGVGAHVRTIALGPGASGGLDAVVPVLAPHPRAPAAGLQLRREARWCDVMVVHGGHPARVACRWVPRDGRLRRVAVLDAAAAAVEAWPVRRLRPLAACATVISTSSSQCRQLEPFGLAPRLLPAAARLPLVDVGEAQRWAARRSLGLAEEAAVLGVAAPLSGSSSEDGSPPVGLLSAAEAAGWAVVPVRGDGTERDEWCGAACDAVVVGRPGTDGPPPRGALVAAAGGAVLIGWRTDLGGLVTEASGVVADGADDLTGALRHLLDPGSVSATIPAMRRRGSLGAELVRRRFSLSEVGGGWVQALLGARELV
jgi:hypothetical protein